MQRKTFSKEKNFQSIKLQTDFFDNFTVLCWVQQNILKFCAFIEFTVFVMKKVIIIFLPSQMLGTLPYLLGIRSITMLPRLWSPLPAPRCPRRWSVMVLLTLGKEINSLHTSVVYFVTKFKQQIITLSKLFTSWRCWISSAHYFWINNENKSERD